MIKERQVFQNLILEYIGTPVITVTIDGVAVMSNITLPTHSVRQTRIVLLPATAIGFVPQLQADATTDISFQFQGVPDRQYDTQNLYQHFELTFKGSVRLNLFLDQLQLKPNLLHLNNLDLSVRFNKTQDTRKIYYPPLSYGYIPHIFQTDLSTKTGQIISFKPISLPARFNKGLRRHSEYQVTYRGDVQLAIFLDGRKVVDRNLPEQQIPQDGGFVTFKDYFPSDSNGNVLQYLQTQGDGEIALFETDQTLLDVEQPQQPMS